MPQKGIIYRILIASPSDVIQERKAIPEVIHRWNAERDSQPYNIEDGKYILDRACSDLLDLRAQIPDSNGKLTDMINESIKSLKAIQRHRLVLDGGLSFKAFWDEGDRIINLLKSILSELGD